MLVVCGTASFCLLVCISKCLRFPFVIKWLKCLCVILAQTHNWHFSGLLIDLCLIQNFQYSTLHVCKLSVCALVQWPQRDLNRQPSDLELDVLPSLDALVLNIYLDIHLVGAATLAGANPSIIKHTQARVLCFSHPPPSQFPLRHQPLCGLWKEQATLCSTKTLIMQWRVLLSTLMLQVYVSLRVKQRTSTSLFPLPWTLDQISGYLMRLGRWFVTLPMYEWVLLKVTKQVTGTWWWACNTYTHPPNLLISALLNAKVFQPADVFSVNTAGTILQQHVKPPGDFSMSFFHHV